MNKQFFVKEIEDLSSMLDEFEKYSEGIGELFGIDASAEGAFVDIYYDVFHKAVKHLATVVDDKGEWIEWYFDEVYNNPFRESLNVEIDGTEYSIATPEDLWEVIHKDFD